MQNFSLVAVDKHLEELIPEIRKKSTMEERSKFACHNLSLIANTLAHALQSPVAPAADKVENFLETGKSFPKNLQDDVAASSKASTQSTQVDSDMEDYEVDEDKDQPVQVQVQVSTKAHESPRTDGFNNIPSDGETGAACVAPRTNSISHENVAEMDPSKDQTRGNALAKSSTQSPTRPMESPAKHHNRKTNYQNIQVATFKHSSKFKPNQKKGSIDKKTIVLRKFPLGRPEAENCMVRAIASTDELQTDVSNRAGQLTALCSEFKNLCALLSRILKDWIIVSYFLMKSLSETNLQNFLQLLLTLLYQVDEPNKVVLKDIRRHALYLTENENYFRGYGDLAQFWKFESESSDKNLDVVTQAIELKTPTSKLGGYQLGQTCAQMLAFTGQQLAHKECYLPSLRRLIKDNGVLRICTGVLTNGLSLVEITIAGATDKYIEVALNDYEDQKLNIFEKFFMVHLRSKEIAISLTLQNFSTVSNFGENDEDDGSETAGEDAHSDEDDDGDDDHDGNASHHNTEGSHQSEAEDNSSGGDDGVDQSKDTHLPSGPNRGKKSGSNDYKHVRIDPTYGSQNEDESPSLNVLRDRTNVKVKRVVCAQVRVPIPLLNPCERVQPFENINRFINSLEMDFPEDDS